MSLRTTTSSQREIFSDNKTVIVNSQADKQAKINSPWPWEEMTQSTSLSKVKNSQQELQSVKSQSNQAKSLLSTRVQSSKYVQLSGPPHPPKVKYSNHIKASHCRTITPSQSEISYLQICQNVNTTSPSMTRKLTISTLRAISGVTKTHSSRTYLAAGRT